MHVSSRAWQTETANNGNSLDFYRLLETLPAAAYSTDAEGLITFYNRRAVTVWGREPKRHDPLDRY